MSDEVERLEQHVARLRRRIEQQAAHVERLADYPELAQRAGAILEQDAESLRQALIQLMQIRKDIAAVVESSRKKAGRP